MAAGQALGHGVGGLDVPAKQHGQPPAEVSGQPVRGSHRLGCRAHPPMVRRARAVAQIVCLLYDLHDRRYGKTARHQDEQEVGGVPDYGHDLLFGVFVPPDAGQKDAVLALAQRADEARLDLVSVQDHPYNPKFLDTWTLLTAIATTTERVSVFPNVANLPL